MAIVHFVHLHIDINFSGKKVENPRKKIGLSVNPEEYASSPDSAQAIICRYVRILIDKAIIRLQLRKQQPCF